MRVKFINSQIFRVFLSSSFLFLVAFFVSAWGAWIGLDALLRVAYDERIEKGLQAYVATVKKLHSAQQRLMIYQIETYLQANKVRGKDLNSEEVRRFFQEFNFQEIDFSRNGFLLSKYDEGIHDELSLPASQLSWIDRDRLRFYDWVITWNHATTYEAFRSAEDSKNFYSLLRSTIQEKLKPTMLRYSLISFLVAICIVLIVSLFLARNFKKQIDAIVEGFFKWSEADKSFRFKSENWAGELEAITVHFNHMADVVDRNQKRNAYLEKIAGWQVMARKLAHEIKNPLTPIRMMITQVLRSYSGEDEKFQKILTQAGSVITDEVNQLTKMVDSFNEFAKLPEARLIPNSLEKVASDIVAMLQPVYQDLNIQLNVFEDSSKESFTSLTSKNEPGAQVWMDAGLIKQLLKNLVKNAAEACTQQKDASIRVCIKPLATNPQKLELSVMDNGPGIPLSHQAKIFDAYFTTKDTGPNPGMGLGLAICHKIALDHGGNLTLDSIPGRTVFSLSLQRVNESGAANEL